MKVNPLTIQTLFQSGILKVVKVKKLGTAEVGGGHLAVAKVF